MTTRCVIVKDVGHKRLFWCETGIGLDWMASSKDVWVYDSHAQAQTVFRAVKLGRQRAKIIPYSDIQRARIDNVTTDGIMGL